ncbi:MAG: prepilin peptidase [Betaproteobacteria bacterium]|nr:prepilin peptidase [Betaproteobacteria bacterium]
MDVIDAFRAQPWFFVGTVLVIGMMVGSFLNVVIHRLPKMMENDWRQQCVEFLHPEAAETAAEAPKPRYNLVIPRSACPSCGHQISAIENVPIFSYMFLRGKCSACKAPISIRYPVVELLTGLATAYAAWRFGVTWTTAFAILYIWALVALTFIDADTTLLPDDITLPLLWLGLLVNLGGMFADAQSAVVGAVAGYLILWIVYWGFKLLTGKEGMGYGDFKLLAAIGAWLGWQMLPLVILLSAVVGTVVGIAGILLRGRERGAKLPFGPYLAAAGFIALFWGQKLNMWYLGRMPT